jgi:hypothetical protein
MQKDVMIPPYLMHGVFPAKRGFPKEFQVIACDTETANGSPYLIQFYDGAEITLKETDTDRIFNEFMSYVRERCRYKGRSTIVFFHNMQFDITAILDKKKEIFQYQHPPVIECVEEGKKIGELELFAQKTWWGRARFDNGATVNLVDSAHFIQGSLFNISRQLGLAHLKPERPQGVSEGKEIQSLDDPEFKSYVEQEILAEHDLAMFVITMHQEYDVNFSVSSSQFASKVFKKHFLKDPIPQCPPYMRQVVEGSLHGGRASNFVDGIHVIPNVRLYDYNSFYPYALANLPPMTRGRWEHVDHFVNEHEGFYMISSHVNECTWPCILKNPATFDYANNEHIRRVPIASYELRDALARDEIELEKVSGYVWIPSENATNPFRDYVREFYAKKNATPKDDPKYTMYKLLLNQIYGKTYQSIPITDYEETPEYDWNNGRIKKNERKFKAGGLYLPHIGSWITSYARAQLHSDLHEYDGLMCATDSILTTREAKTGDGLGDLKLECEGLGLVMRPKMYFIFSKEIQERVMEEGSLRSYLEAHLDELEVGRDIVKFATHGFWGSPHQLLELYVNEETDYFTKHMNKIRESLKQHKTPRIMEDIKRSIAINWYDERGTCGLPKRQAMRERELCTGSCFTCAYSY